MRAGQRAKTSNSSLKMTRLILLACAILLAASVAVAPAQPAVADIRGHWAEARIADLVQRGIIGLGAGRQFHPRDSVARGQFIAWLLAARGLPVVRMDRAPFTDLPLSSEFAAPVESAVIYGILQPGGAFRPGAPITRVDALVYTVRALGHTFESAYMANARVPFSDVEGLPPLVRGAIAVAALSNPPLLREPASDRLRASDPLSRASAASLLWAYLQGVEHGITLRFAISLGTGETLILEKRGTLRPLPVWRVQVGVFQDEDRARRAGDGMRSRGQPVFIEQVDDLFKVRLGNFATRDEAVAFQQQLSGEGVSSILIVTLREYESLSGPFWMGMLLLEPTAGVRLRPALARDGAIGRERTSEAARRAGAVAAINGGFFSSAGDPLGCLMIDGELISEPLPGRTCAGLTDDGSLLFDTLKLEATASTENGSLSIDGVNRDRSANEILLYRPVFGPTTRTNVFGLEVVVAVDVVQQVTDGRGNNAIPPGGYVLSGHGRGREALRAVFRQGDRVTLRVRLVPESGDARWDTVRHVMGGGPRLLTNGIYVGGEGFQPLFVDRRHPRTAIGRLADGRIILVVVGGRQPYHSLGMTLPELAFTLRRLGVTDAMNLDGGGSSTLVVRGVVINLPSDELGERTVSDVVLVIPPSNGNP
jgi:hypothetical protein